MRILTVIPIARGISKDTLTYFTKKDAPVGSIVSIPLRNKTIYGLVTETKEATEVKSELKSLSYSIRKVDKIETKSFLSPSFIESCTDIANYSAGSVGSVLSALIPKAILEGNINTHFVPKEFKDTSFYETLLLQTDDEERYTTYRSLIREEFAKNRSVFFCLPTTEDLLTARGALEKGIDQYTFTLHSGLPKKEIMEIWQKVISENHPVLIIATGSFLAIPREDIRTIILEKESSRAYKMPFRPFLDIRTVAELFAKEAGIRLVLGDILLRAETLWEEKNGNYTELAPLKFRSLSTASCELIDIRAPQNMKKKEFSIFDDKTKDLIKTARENNEHTFLFCGRKGLYPMTVCSDCGTPVICKNCNAPITLYKNPNTAKSYTGQGKFKSKNLFVCHHCGERRDANELCAHCGGWRLNPLGIGVERVVEEVETLFPGIKVFIMDKDHVSTHKQAVKVREAFHATPGSVLVGTELALTYLNEKIENSVVVSLDAFFSIPDFRINEKIFHILLTLRSISEKHMIIQTREQNTKIFDYAIHGNLIDFYRDEIEDRKMLNYPPFATNIKITLEGTKNTIKTEMDRVVEFMKPYEMQIFDSWNPGGQSKFTIHGLISILKNKWVDTNLLEKLKTLPPHFMIKVDPDTLL